MKLRTDVKLEEKQISYFKNDKNLMNIDMSLQKICTLTDCFCEKYIIFDLRKYKGVIFQDTEESCKI